MCAINKETFVKGLENAIKLTEYERQLGLDTRLKAFKYVKSFGYNLEMKELLQIINTAYVEPFFEEEVYTALITFNRIKAIDSILELK